jgi:beta-lactamase class A
MKSFFTRRIPVYVLILMSFLTGGAVYFIESGLQKHQAQQQQTIPVPSGSMNQLRQTDFQLVHPLMLADVANESPVLSVIKQDLQQYVNETKNSQQASDVSIYFRRMNDGAWFTINAEQVYNPASLIKVAYLITYLKEAEQTPGLLDHKLHFEKHNTLYSQNIKTPGLSENKDYTIRYLLNHMIQYSDNDATVLLQENVDNNVFLKLFRDLNMPSPDLSKEYFMSTADMAKLFRVLYNGTYLSKEGSEFALEVLTRSEYKDGLLGGIDQPVTVAHKFGERVMGNSAQLHEFGIIYCGDQPYLIGVMTTGVSLQQLSAVVKKISQLAFHQYKSSFGC